MNTRGLTKSICAFSVLFALGACSNDDYNDPIEINSAQSLSVMLDASQEIPTPIGVPAGASGSAEVSVDNNGVVTATLGVSNLTGPASMAHIHRGFTGSTGPVLISLTSDDGGSTWSVPVDARPLTADEIGAFNRGELYFNVHTAANAPGEIRGQIDPGNTTTFIVRLEKTSTPETLNVLSDRSTQPVPLSPGAYIVHREAVDGSLLLPQDAANAGLEAIAKVGNLAPYPHTVPGAAVFNIPVGASEPGPIGPGAAYEFTIQAVDGDKLDFVTMFIPSNDWFYNATDADNGLDLLVNEQPNSGDAPDTRVSSINGRGQSVSLNGQVLRVTILPQQKQDT